MNLNKLNEMNEEELKLVISAAYAQLDKLLGQFYIGQKVSILIFGAWHAGTITTIHNENCSVEFIMNGKQFTACRSKSDLIRHKI